LRAWLYSGVPLTRIEPRFPSHLCSGSSTNSHTHRTPSGTFPGRTVAAPWCCP